MALVETRSDYLALVCMGLARNMRCHRDSMLQHGTGNPISLFNYRTNSSKARCQS